ncbi:MAG: L,D-transpeptidase family protein [Clostridiales bacterium]|nr:L,D-transpeptidase family protein [Clostridiales bacterium]
MRRMMRGFAAIILALTVLVSGVVPNSMAYAAEVSEDIAAEEIQSGTEEDEALILESASEEAEVSEEETDAAVADTSADEEEIEAEEDETVILETAADSGTVPTLQYQTHVAKKGWLSAVSEGKTAGTTGQSLAVEAFKISLQNVDSDEWAGSGITYSAHVQSIGWQSSVSNGAVAGTTGQSKRVEAITIKLTGPIAEKYDVYYRVHTQSYGWLSWAKNGEKAGSSGYSKRIEAIQVVLVEKGGAAPGSTSKSYVYSRVSTQAYVQTYGWQSSVMENVVSGTVGQNKRLEAIRLQLSSEIEYSGSIQYQVYVQGYGWMDWKSNGATAGTTGQSKRIEAIRIKLTGDVANYYDVYYSVHMSKIGWCNYACNGETTGTTELSKPIQAIKVCLVKKGVDTAPSTSGTKYIAGYSSSAFTYSAQITGGGSTGTVAQKATLGTTGQSKQLQNITLYLSGSSSSLPSGTIQYATHVSGTGWTGWSSCGTASGSSSSSRGLEAVKIQLTGNLANYYDIYYRAHVEKYGWLGWAKNGQTAGTTGISYRLEALQIVLVPKDCSAPGANANYYTNQKKITATDAMQAKAMQYSSPTQYLIMVDRDSHKVGIFKGSKGKWEYLYKWDCANGKASTPTVAGVFSVQNKGYYFDSGSSRCYWWTQFYGNYLFHSVLYTKSGTLQDGRVGMALSHGCVRLKIENAKWIYDNVPRGTTVVVY